jgi:hypothetical protein
MPAPTNPAPEEEATKVVSYRVICISMFKEDLRELDEMVRALKARGIGRASRSSLIRYALREIDLDRVEDLR